MATLPGYGADGLGLHGVADSDVPLHSEGGEGEGGHVDGQKLGVDHERAAQTAPDPSVPQNVVREDFLQFNTI